MNHNCITTTTVPPTVVNLYLQKFFIQVFDEKKNCEECGTVYEPKYNFCMIACCGPVIRVCNTCNWEIVPCVNCKEKEIGDIIISKKINCCTGCRDEKLVKKMMEKNI